MKKKLSKANHFNYVNFKLNRNGKYTVARKRIDNRIMNEKRDSPFNSLMQFNIVKIESRLFCLRKWI